MLRADTLDRHSGLPVTAKGLPVSIDDLYSTVRYLGSRGQRVGVVTVPVRPGPEYSYIPARTGWFHRDALLRTATRSKNHPDDRSDNHGFRCAREVVLVQLEDEAAGPSKICDSALRAGILKASGSFSPIAVAGSIHAKVRCLKLIAMSGMGGPIASPVSQRPYGRNSALSWLPNRFRGLLRFLSCQHSQAISD